MKKKLQSIIDANKDNIGHVGTDSEGNTAITNKENEILYFGYIGKDKFVDFDSKTGKIKIIKE